MKIRLGVTALLGGLLGAVEKVETEKHILVSLPSLLRHSLGNACMLETSPRILLPVFPHNLLITIFM